MDLPAKQGRNSEAYIKNLARVGAKYATAREGFEKQQDLLKAFQFYNQAAQYGHPGSNYELGIMYESGVPGSGGFAVEKDLAKAIKFYKVAADGGMVFAGSREARFGLFFFLSLSLNDPPPPTHTPHLGHI
mmetsp:Transcript_32760/g.73962  ORF Transcript_32760/g.73962 Transcript_32760/m.73962 type:complete len:131 (+) Transcript_32760:84-476(+)